MSDVVIVGAKRTAIGSFLGQFTGVPTPTLGAAAIEAALAQAGIGADKVDEVIMGCVLPAGLGQAPARQASRAAGIPDATHAVTATPHSGAGWTRQIWHGSATTISCATYARTTKNENM